MSSTPNLPTLLEKNYPEEFEALRKAKDVAGLNRLVVKAINDNSLPLEARTTLLEIALTQNYEAFSSSLVLFRPIHPEEIAIKLHDIDFSNDALFATVFPPAGEARRFFLNGANLSGRNFDEIDLKGTSFREANLKEASFKESYLEFVKMDGAQLIDADLTGAHIWESTFKGANCTGAVFRNADISGADFTDAVLVNANFSYPDSPTVDIDVKGADIKGADFSGVDLESIKNLHLAKNLDFAKFEGAINKHILIEAKRQRPSPPQLPSGN